MHIVQLPAYDNANERARVQQLMHAEENIEMSKEGRKNKRRLWAPLKDQLSPELREETVVAKKLQVTSFLFRSWWLIKILFLYSTRSHWQEII